MHMLANEVELNATIRAGSYSTADSATLDGDEVDIGESIGPILVMIDAAEASAGETMTFAVQHSYDGSTNWTNIPSDALVDPDTGDADTFDTNSATNAVLQTLAVKRDRVRQYLRVQGTAAGNGTPTYIVGAYIAFRKQYAE